MTPSRRDRRPWSALAVITIFVVGLAGLISLVPYDESFEGDPAGSVALILAFVAFDIVGALIIWRRPGNALGWIMAAVGVLAAWSANFGLRRIPVRNRGLLTEFARPR